MGRFLESYVLQSIGFLSDEKARELDQLAPKLRKAFGVEGETFFEVLANQMRFEPDASDEILQIWTEVKVRAEAQGLSVDPNEFARQFVDANFSDD